MSLDICDNCWVSPASTAVDGADGVQVNLCTTCTTILQEQGSLDNVSLKEEDE